ncbi:MAG: hypothetical protein ACFFB2_02985 [Promethearchaeota archaeon]
MKEVRASIIETIVFAMVEREKAKRALSEHKDCKSDLNLLLASIEYYIQANLWLLQSGKESILGEILI